MSKRRKPLPSATIEDQLGQVLEVFSRPINITIQLRPDGHYHFVRVEIVPPAEQPGASDDAEDFAPENWTLDVKRPSYLG